MGRHVSRSPRGNNIIEQLVTGAPQRTDRIVYLSGDINEQSISNVSAQLFSMAGMDSVQPIHLVVSTYGGFIDEMFGLYDAMQFLPCPVYTIGLGKIMSAGVLILAAGKKGHRQIGANARVMIHPVSGGAGGNVFEVINETEEMKRMQRSMCDLLIECTKMTKSQVDKFMKAGHDCYITPQEAVNLGIVDNIVTSKK